MENKSINAWKKIRATGCSAWVIKRGILGFGLPLGLFFAIQTWFNSGFVQASIVFVPAAVIAGVSFGLITWHISEWRYRSHEKKSEICQASLKDTQK